MNCPTADKLSQFADQLLSKQEMTEIETHVQSCTSCEKVIDAFKEEHRFIEKTLQTPTLPENFTDVVLDQLEPYGKTKKNRHSAIWKRVAVTAAGLVLAVGIGATVNPSFAQFIGGLFSTDQVDDGLKIAAEAGLAKRVDLQVEDQGLTLVVEDVIADSSRVSISYKVLDKNGKPQDTYLNLSESDNIVTAIDQYGQELEEWGFGWQQGSDYGNIEFSLRNHDESENVTIQFNLVEINGVKGNWQLAVPVDLQENLKLTKRVNLKDATAIHHGVQVDLKKLHMAPSSIALFFETAITEEEMKKSTETWHKFEEMFGKASMDALVLGSNTEIAYHIENAKGEVIYSNGRSSDSETSGMLQGSGEEIDTSGGTAWIDSFVPKNEEQLLFVLDGVYKTEPANYSLTIKPKDLKKQPVSFNYKGNHLTVKSVKKPLFGDDKSVVIKLEGGMDSLDADFGNWIAIDNKGNSYPANFSGSILDEKEINGRHKATLDLQLDGLEKVPEELTLYLVSMRTYYPLEENWKVPLTE